MRKGKNKEMKEMTKLTFENVPQVTYWRNPNSGVIYHCSIFRNTWVETDEFEEGGYSYDTEKSFVSISSINTRYELGYYYTWDELVEKFEYLCSGDDVDEDYYVNILANKRLYREFRYCKDRLPRLRRLMKSEPDSHWLDDYDDMVANVEKYNNLETFELEF